MKADEPTDALPYRGDLVPDLQGEHKHIVRLLEEFSVAHRDDRVDEAINALMRFSGALRTHLLKENLHLYVYLSQVLQRDREAADVMRSMRREMQSIGRSLNEFAARYTSAPWDSRTKCRISNELDGIREALLRRIECEETVLYPLYLPRGFYGGTGTRATSTRNEG